MLKRTVFDATVLLLAIAVFPVAIALLFVLRGVFVIGGVAALAIGAIVYSFSPDFRKWCEKLIEPLVRYRGLRLATNVGFHPSHSWARVDDEVMVGVDDLVQATLGPVDAVQLPDNGTHVERGQPLFTLRHGDRCVAVPSPVSGTVIGVNPDLRGHPELINTAPFANGWVVRIHSEDPRGEWKHLLRGRRAWNWFRSAADRVIDLVPDRGGNGNGGNELYRRLDAGAWRELNKTMFSAAADDHDLKNQPSQA